MLWLVCHMCIIYFGWFLTHSKFSDGHGVAHSVQGERKERCQRPHCLFVESIIPFPFIPKEKDRGGDHDTLRPLQPGQRNAVMTMEKHHSSNLLENGRTEDDHGNALSGSKVSLEKGMVAIMARYLVPLLTKGVGGDGHGHIPHLPLRGKGSGGGVPFIFWNREWL